MADEPAGSDPGAVWRSQPEEEVPVYVHELMERRSHSLREGTRLEILTSIIAAVLFVLVMAWRLAPLQERIPLFGIVAVAAWVLISLWWFRKVILRAKAAPPDAFAASGVAHLRKELEGRRDHLRNAWIWHGPLVLACVIVIGTAAGSGFPGAKRLVSALPLALLLIAWTAFGLWRRLRQARQIQREIDEIGEGAKGG